MAKHKFTDSELYESRFGFREANSSFCFYAVLLAILFFFIGFRVYFENTFGGVVVDGPSMKNTLQSGDELLMRYLKDGEKASRGDVIIVDVRKYRQDSTTQFLIKRLIATEGDKVYCTDGQVYVQYQGESEFVALDEPYARYVDAQAYDFDVYTVGEGEIFFLGDNRNYSCDSRYYDYPSGSNLFNSLYKEEDIYGVVPAWAIEKKDALSFLFFAQHISK